MGVRLALSRAKQTGKAPSLGGVESIVRHTHMGLSIFRGHLKVVVSFFGFLSQPDKKGILKTKTQPHCGCDVVYSFA